MTEPLGDVPATSFLDSLGVRGRRRAEPRTSIAIAGAGCALAVLGVLIVAGDTGTSGGDFNRVPGVVLSALVVAAGYAMLAATRQGPIATAGAAAAALGVPPLMFFLTFDEGSSPPYSTEGILIVSTLAWLATYVIGPGRGRPFFLGAGLLGAWLGVLQLTENVFDAPFVFVGVTASSDGGFDEPTIDVPDPTTIALLSLAFGLGYLVLCRWLDRRGHHGTATPFALATLPTLFVGVVALADELEQAGTGLLAMLVGAVLAYHGATVGRRVTAWVGGGATALGVAVFLGDMTDDATVGGMLFLAAGIALVATAHAVAAALNEADEMAVTNIATRQPAAVAAPAGPGPIPPPPGAAPGGEDLSLWMPPSADDTPPPPPPPPPPPA
jgi:hypothetical protein